MNITFFFLLAITLLSYFFPRLIGFTRRRSFTHRFVGVATSLRVKASPSKTLGRSISSLDLSESDPGASLRSASARMPGD